MHRLFALIKRRTVKKKCSSTLLDYVGNKFFSANDKANALSDYFSNVFNSPSSSCPSLDTISHSDCPMPVIMYSEVLKHLKTTKGLFSITADGIPPFFLTFADYLCQPLTHICLILGKVPSIWKKAVIKPIPKA
ncbi:hypothetical protein Y032_0930g3088 [Ancylostoma ceylanicum]|uniref:Uncharacterized protein n=1 Tax=Ancylostoma ceylanicum TaxID=53326 RepID=A0A016WAV7_9BILA|nr:hypothetical protein Y032_0930g3088 [Ancylostoma ceylanicum]